VVARDHLYSPADVQRLPADVETALWPLVCNAVRAAAIDQEWDALLAALGWFQRQPVLDLRPFLAAGSLPRQERGLAVVERLKLANLGPVRVILDELNMPRTLPSVVCYPIRITCARTHSRTHQHHSRRRTQPHWRPAVGAS
jgi:hypothetical protein